MWWIFLSGFLNVLWRGLNFWGSDFYFLLFVFYFDFRGNGKLRAYKLDLYFNLFNFLFIRKVGQVYKTFIQHAERITNSVLHSILLWVSQKSVAGIIHYFRLCFWEWCQIDCLCSMDLYPWHANAIGLEKSRFLSSVKKHEMAGNKKKVEVNRTIILKYRKYVRKI